MGAEDGGIALADTVAAMADDPADDSSAPPPTGGARFSVGEVLGRGGMGTVYVAHDAQFGREVALKAMSSEHAGSEARRRFLIEGLVTGNLEHPGIPAVYERGVRGGQPYYAMRKVAGRTLGAAANAATSFEARLALLPAIVQVAHTLGFAHERGVVHRDVKPENVILGDHGETILLDWGIARVEGQADPVTGEQLSGERAGSGSTRAGSVMGTPAYMAPEQAAGRIDAIDARTDVFALGAMLYHVLGGLAPYDGKTSAEVIDKALRGERPPLSRLSPQAPPALLSIVATAMAQDPDDRYPHAAAFADAVQGFLTGAVSAPRSKLVSRLAQGAAWLVLALALVGVAAFFGQRLPGFESQGLSSYAYLITFALGVMLSLIEWRTKGVHHLSPLILALAAFTFLTGVAGAAMGVGLVLGFVSDLPLAQRPEVLVSGLWETTGSVPFSATLCSIQLLLWALARRATLLASGRQGPRRLSDSQAVGSPSSHPR